MSTNGLNIPNGLVLVPVQLQSDGTGLVSVQMQSGGPWSAPGSGPDTRLLEFKRRSPQALGVNNSPYLQYLFYMTSHGKSF